MGVQIFIFILLHKQSLSTINKITKWINPLVFVTFHDTFIEMLTPVFIMFM